ncbi:LD-carboxypeptidase [Candidatus Sulfidibacterium hydrothermale]|uniref:S66 peptidase family protein n=1 Tax=Candidatus Sulfidibacterium hydrothermale TaxID=2875962 RepID=UPI001F0B0A2A|nr:LD-carboxypeptidase [Candidatus Sulfidibacterium hydrothermale]UBM61982.1 LD-carboxypeptidase [Candidatus Sulfidibacterium hydrothermale]
MSDRRTFIKSMVAVGALSALPPLGLSAQSITNPLKVKHKPARIVPKRLEQGDTIGLVTPGSPITEKQLQGAVKTLEGMGYKTHYLPSVLSEYGYFAGTDKERADELMHMFANTEVDAIMCVRGGYGSIRVLDLLDYEIIRKNPKIFIGYSDITALLSAINERTGLVCFHGPMGISEFDDFTLKVFRHVLIDPSPRYKYPYKREENTENNPEFDFYTIREGKAEGELIGGNLSVLASMAGSDFETDFENKIVFIEEIEEKTYRVDRMLTQLVQATNLRKANGIVLGIFYKCSENDPPTIPLKRAIEDILKPLNIPVAYGFPFGHIQLKMTLPVGTLAKFNATRRTLKLMEESVS